MTTLRELFRQVGNLFRWWYVVAPWEQSVRVRLGSHVDVLGAGVHLRIPLVDRVFRQSIRRRYSPVPTQTLTTADGQCLTVSGRIGYAIEDIGKLYDTLHHAEEAIQCEARAALARFVVAAPLTGPADLETHVTSVLDLGRYGIADAEFFITDFAVVRTYRLIQGEPNDWTSGDNLDTSRDDDHERD